ncbi:PDT-domain-containing protein [Teratosphaeria nubilosa]|uniref:prephenate dehydratase n=1 Tax=Teratosphaeria nubilosa TaxID=161662 RepID=A0A6G1L1K1_9PEZI|nr:PDT-domain-containing protein [Teratosphaeria nubilosa]
MAQNSHQKNKTIAFLGPEASYTHQATLNAFPPSTHSLTPVPTIEDVFAAVQSRTSDHGVVPFENSSNGSVVFTLDLFADLQGRYANILVCGERYLPVRHCLLGRRPDSGPNPPDNDLSKIQTLYSHPQAWGQCKNFLATRLNPTTTKQDTASTAAAAARVATSPDHPGTTAAIASSLAAKIHPSLAILAEGIEDNPQNSTRFLVLRHADSPPPFPTKEEAEEKYKTLLSFTLNHGQPGALASCLEVFKIHALNLTSINTRPSGEAAWHYVFFVEVLGRKRGEGDGGRVNEALRELGRVAKGWRWLGSWEGGEEVGR